jgi:hypothetical protein
MTANVRWSRRNCEIVSTAHAGQEAVLAEGKFLCRLQFFIRNPRTVAVPERSRRLGWSSYFITDKQELRLHVRAVSF